MEKLNVGDVVRLKSGSPDMTVAELWRDGIHAECRWFVNSMPVKDSFVIETLTKD